MTSKNIPLKKRHLSFSESNSSFTPDKSPIVNPDDSNSLTVNPSNQTHSKPISQPITTNLPSKKRWLLANITENPSKKKVSLTEYLKRKNTHDNSDSDLSVDLDGAKDISADSSNGILSDLPIQSLEERKKELQKALLSMEERRKHQNPHQKDKDKEQQEKQHHHHHHPHNHKKHKNDKNKIKETNKQQIKEFSHFVKKQEKRLKSRQEAKVSGTASDSSNSNGLTSTVNQFKLINESLKLEIQKLKAQQLKNNNNNVNDDDDKTTR